MSSPRAPAGHRKGLVCRNINRNHALQSADTNAEDITEIPSTTNAEDLSKIPCEHAALDHVRHKNREVNDFLQGCPFFVLDLVEGVSFYGATASDLTTIPFEFPTEVSAIIITCMLSREANAERYLLKLRAARKPIIILCVDEDICFHTDQILGVHDRFLELGASDMILQSASTNLNLEILMRVRSARRANHVRCVEVDNRLEHQRKSMFWPFVHRIMEGFPKLSDAYDSQMASRKIWERMQAGSFGTVFKYVNDTKEQEKVVKSVPKSRLKDIEQVMGIWQEIVLLQKLDHPNVVACHGAKHTNTEVLIFMDYAGPRNLRAYLKSSKCSTGKEECINIATGINITGQILAGLAHCHANGVAHRDVKPENIVAMVGDGIMKVRIVDFGLATESTKACTDFVGTVPFIAPEVATRWDHEQYDPACADMWSCGVVFLEVLCGVGKINRMLRWNDFPNSRFKYREDLASFFSIESMITVSVEADVGSVGSASFPTHAHTSLLGMLTLDPRYRWNAITAFAGLKQGTGLSASASCDF